MRSLLALIIFVLLLQSCKQKADPLTNHTYTANKIGWTIKLPGRKWSLISEKPNEKDAKKMEDFFGTDIDFSKVADLINFKKNDRNTFMSSIEPFKETEFGDYDDMLTLQHEVLKKLYATKNVPAKYEIGASRIGGKMLDWFTIIIGQPNKGKKLTLRMYSCMLNNYFFTMAITFDNPEDEETLMNVVYSSEFTNKVK